MKFFLKAIKIFVKENLRNFALITYITIDSNNYFYVK